MVCLGQPGASSCDFGRVGPLPSALRICRNSILAFISLPFTTVMLYCNRLSLRMFSPYCHCVFVLWIARRPFTRLKSFVGRSGCLTIHIRAQPRSHCFDLIQKFLNWVAAAPWLFLVTGLLSSATPQDLFRHRIHRVRSLTSVAPSMLYSSLRRPKAPPLPKMGTPGCMSCRVDRKGQNYQLAHRMLRSN